VFNMMLIMMVS